MQFPTIPKGIRTYLSNAHAPTPDRCTPTPEIRVPSPFGRPTHHRAHSISRKAGRFSDFSISLSLSLSLSQIAVFLLYLSTEAVPRPGTYPYPPIVGVGGAHGTIARARSTLRRGDLGLDRCFHCGRGGAETAATLPGGANPSKSAKIPQNPSKSSKTVQNASKTSRRRWEHWRWHKPHDGGDAPKTKCTQDLTTAVGSTENPSRRQNQAKSSKMHQKPHDGGGNTRSIKIKQNRPKSIQIVQNGAPYPTKREQREPFFEAVSLSLSLSLELYFLVSLSLKMDFCESHTKRTRNEPGLWYHGHHRPRHSGGRKGPQGRALPRSEVIEDF
jgi:hypothetical protein